MITFAMDPAVLWVMAGLYVILVIASLILWLMKRRAPDKNYTELTQRIQSWWVMVTVFLLAMLLSRNVSLVFFGSQAG